jgi:lipid A ethanolaminephosphotransferase
MRQQFFSPLHPTPAAGRWQHPVWLMLTVSAWLAFVCNSALWRELANIVPTERPSLGFSAVLMLMLTALHMLLLSLFNWHYSLKIFAIFLLFSAGFGSYFMWTYHIIIDANMLLNVLQTDVREARDLFNWRLPATVFILSVLPSWLIWRWPVRHAALWQQSARNALSAALALGVFALLLWAVFQSFSSTMRNHMQLRSMMNPLNSVYALLDLGVVQRLQTPRPFVPLAVKAERQTSAPGSKPPLLVLVLGETARAANFSLGTYARDTNPQLRALQRARDGSVLSYRSINACGTSTATSVPCMFSHLGRNAFETRSQDDANLLDVLYSAGLGVLWLDNQSGCKGVCDRVPSVDVSDSQDAELCVQGECLDGILPKRLPLELAKLPPERRRQGVVVVMHMMGSHGPAYYKRSAPAQKTFLPECLANVLQDCTPQTLVNAYDNSLRYTDHVLAQTIAWLKTQEKIYSTAMMYVSDHGESLGENNLFLHGMPYALAPTTQTKVPLITWLSPAMQKHAEIDSNCFSAQTTVTAQQHSHDGLFHSASALLGVRHAWLRKDWNWYANCPATKTKD